MTLFFALLACSTPAPESAPVNKDASHGANEHPSGSDHKTDHAKDEPVAKPSGVAGADKMWTHYGEGFSTQTSMDAAALIAAPDAKVDQVVRVSGRIENVCQKAGCWMVLADDEGQYIRVTMKNHGFGLPTDTATGEGTQADVEGKLIAKKLDEKTLAHLKSEAKGTEEEMTKQFAPKYEIVATGVAVKNRG